MKWIIVLYICTYRTNVEEVNTNTKMLEKRKISFVKSSGPSILILEIWISFINIQYLLGRRFTIFLAFLHSFFREEIVQHFSP